MSELKPNHICKNPNCNKGVDGKRKQYYACDYCTKTQSWRSVACCFECYDEYMSAVKNARIKNQNIDILPERTDMTREEVVNLVMNTPIEEVKQKTKEDLSDYADDIETLGFSKTMDKINNNLSKKKSKK